MVMSSKTNSSSEIESSSFPMSTSRISFMSWRRSIIISVPLMPSTYLILTRTAGSISEQSTFSMVFSDSFGVVIIT